jgi:hypothetical protein
MLERIKGKFSKDVETLIVMTVHGAIALIALCIALSSVPTGI